MISVNVCRPENVKNPAKWEDADLTLELMDNGHLKVSVVNEDNHCFLSMTFKNREGIKTFSSLVERHGLNGFMQKTVDDTYYVMISPEAVGELLGYLADYILEYDK